MPSTVEQRNEALEAANEKRSQRARLKRQVAAGEVPLAVVILDPPEFLQTTSSNGSVTIADLLSWQCRWGLSRAQKLCRELGIPHGIELSGLSWPRRVRLARALGV